MLMMVNLESDLGRDIGIFTPEASTFLWPAAQNIALPSKLQPYPESNCSWLVLENHSIWRIILRISWYSSRILTRPSSFWQKSCPAVSVLGPEVTNFIPHPRQHYHWLQTHLFHDSLGKFLSHNTCHFSISETSQPHRLTRWKSQPFNSRRSWAISKAILRKQMLYWRLARPFL